MSLLTWRSGRVEDRDALRAFQCTPNPTRARLPFGPRGAQHKAPYELRVQALIRQDLKPARVPHRTTLLGWTRDEQLGGVVSYLAVGSEQKFKIDVIAVALALRRRGGGWAREGLTTALDFITAEADQHGFHAALIAASVHEDNRPAQDLFEREGFRVTGEEPDGYQTWALELIVSGGIFD